MQISFAAPSLGDKPWVDELLARAELRGCDINFTNLFVWSGAYDQCIALVEGFLVVRGCGSLGCSYYYPVGEGDVGPALEAIRADAEARGAPLQFVCLSPDEVQELELRYPGQFAITPDRDGWDYLYDIDRLADVAGKKLHAKRNHINRFEEANADWVYEEMTPETMPECLAMDREWYRRSLKREGEEEERDLGDEGRALRLAMEHFGALGLMGGLVRVLGEVVAFTMGDPISRDVFDVHFEKAYGELQGAYALINREFARRVREKYPEVRFLNREDDMGVEGLRKAKESYYPDEMAEKYTAVAQGQPPRAATEDAKL